MDLATLDKYIKVTDIGTSSYSLYLCELAISCTTTNDRGKVFEIPIASNGIDRSLKFSKLKCLSEINERFESFNPSNMFIDRCASQFDGQKIPIESLLRYPKSVYDSSPQLEGYHEPWLVETIGLITSKKYLVPLSCIFPRFDLHVVSENFIGEIDSSGMVSGFVDDGRDLSLNGLYEVLERDAIMRSWRNPDFLVQDLGLEFMDEVQIGHLRKLHLTAKVYNVGLPGLIPVVLVLVMDTLNRVTCGSCAGQNIKKACTHAAHESLMIRFKLIREGIEKCKPGSAITQSLHHVIHGFYYGQKVVAWFEGLSKLDSRTAFAKNKSELLKNCNDFFMYEPLQFNIKEDIENTVIKVIIPNCMRKEWTHKFQFDIPNYKKTNNYNKMPHPYG